MAENKQQLIQQLYELGAVQRGDFVLKSGQRSEWYIDLRQVFANPKLMTTLTKAMCELIDPEQVDLVCGVPYGGLPFATLVAYHLDKPLLMVRKNVKNHGRQRLFEGTWEEGQRCVIIEDVITTGNSANEIVEQLVAHGLRVTGLVTGVDRKQGAGESLNPWGIHFKSVLNLNEIAAQLHSL